MPKRYARDFRRAFCERLVAGERVSSLSEELGISEATLYLWKRQALIDAGGDLLIEPGIATVPVGRLAERHWARTLDSSGWVVLKRPQYPFA